MVKGHNAFLTRQGFSLCLGRNFNDVLYGKKCQMVRFGVAESPYTYFSLSLHSYFLSVGFVVSLRFATLLHFLVGRWGTRGVRTSRFPYLYLQTPSPLLHLAPVPL